MKRLKVGRRPTALAASRDGRFVYVANTFGESVSIVDLQQRQQMAEIPLGPPAELSLADQGELLFFDGRLSHDGWMTCNSCHTVGHTNGMLNDNLSDTTPVFCGACSPTPLRLGIVGASSGSECQPAATGVSRLAPWVAILPRLARSCP